jgi:hypothetical protein
MVATIDTTSQPHDLAAHARVIRDVLVPEGR